MVSVGGQSLFLSSNMPLLNYQQSRATQLCGQAEPFQQTLIPSNKPSGYPVRVDNSVPLVPQNQPPQPLHIQPSILAQPVDKRDQLCDGSPLSPKAVIMPSVKAQMGDSASLRAPGQLGPVGGASNPSGGGANKDLGGGVSSPLGGGAGKDTVGGASSPLGGGASKDAVGGASSPLGGGASNEAVQHSGSEALSAEEASRPSPIRTGQAPRRATEYGDVLQEWAKQHKLQLQRQLQSHSRQPIVGQMPPPPLPLRGHPGEPGRVKVTRTKSCGPFLSPEPTEPPPPIQPDPHPHLQPPRPPKTLPTHDTQTDRRTLHKALALEGLRDWYLRNTSGSAQQTLPNGTANGSAPDRKEGAGRTQLSYQRETRQHAPQKHPTETQHVYAAQMPHSVTFHGQPLHCRFGPTDGHWMWSWCKLEKELWVTEHRLTPSPRPQWSQEGGGLLLILTRLTRTGPPIPPYDQRIPLEQREQGSGSIRYYALASPSEPQLSIVKGLKEKSLSFQVLKISLSGDFVLLLKR
ncbi:hypothetical protein NHX12_013305 [Muraenolepis orangiensis]|uniref:Uncharacterized protein n=1 Tax=Muraenolepis orangiensis TaxID=630683 RepID=A0A9Q0DED3_9TELE|nr:hypothetical protein NHX12_013305 [Muraenolepis orangiensis]